MSEADLKSKKAKKANRPKDFCRLPARESKAIDEAGRKLLQYAEDASCGHLFELLHTGNSGGLFHDCIIRALYIAKYVEPDLADAEKVLDPEHEKRILEMYAAYQRAFFAIGMVTGARMADASGVQAQRVVEGWKRYKTILAI